MDDEMIASLVKVAVFIAGLFLFGFTMHQLRDSMVAMRADADTDRLSLPTAAAPATTVCPGLDGCLIETPALAPRSAP